MFNAGEDNHKSHRVPGLARLDAITGQTQTQHDGLSRTTATPGAAGSWIDISTRQSNASSTSAGELTVNGLLHTTRNNQLSVQSFITEENLLLAGASRRATNQDSSSQDEYEESESESDRVMTSSNESIHSSASGIGARESASGRLGLDELHGESDCVEVGTTPSISRATNRSSFTPQPNAFSHPPSSQFRERCSEPGSYFPTVSRPPSEPRQRPLSAQPYVCGQLQHGASTGQHQPNHEAALLRSLNTLLSCAAAARGLSSSKFGAVATSTNPVPATGRVEASTLRMVPESVALGLERPSLVHRHLDSSQCSSSRAPSPHAGPFASLSGATVTSERSKRRAGRSSSKDRSRLAKKAARNNVDEPISPTLLTWMVSASVLVLISALSFSAGYKVGREDGLYEGIASGTSLARPVPKGGLGLRKGLRWNGPVTVNA